jgi:hypothetical protein
METTQTVAQPGSKLLFGRYKNGNDRSWSLRWKPSGGGKPVTLCRSQKDAPAVTHDIMEELFEDPMIESRLNDIMRRRGEP